MKRRYESFPEEFVAAFLPRKDISQDFYPVTIFCSIFTQERLLCQKVELLAQLSAAIKGKTKVLKFGVF